MDSFLTLQHDPELGLLRGSFVVLFRHGRWYFVGSQVDGQNRTVRTVAVLSPPRALSMIAEAPSSALEKLSELGAGFAEEIKNKVLPSPADYLSLLRSHAAVLTAGPHTDMMQTTEYSEATDAALSKAVTKMLNAETSTTFIRFH